MRNITAALILYGGLYTGLSTAILNAQDTERVTVPFSEPNAAKTVSVTMIMGHNLTVKAYSGKEVIVEAQGGGINRGRRDPPPGMRRIGPNSASLTVEESNNEVRIQLGVFGRGGDITLQVPAETALKIRTMTNGNVTVEGTTGEIDVDSLNGNVTLSDVSGAVVAHSLNGKLLVTMNQVSGKPMSFSTLNGVVDVTLPASIKADLKMKSGQGDIFSDFDIMLKPSPQQSVTISQGVFSKGKRYKFDFDRAMGGTINGGGPEVQFTTFNGTIYIRKK